jgi:hypothetical protein
VKSKYDRVMPRKRAVAAAVVVLGVLAACSSEDDTADTSTSTTPAPTTIVAPTTTVPVPTTTTAPTTTIDPAIELAAQVEADFREAIRLTSEAFQDPANDENVAAALDGYLGVNRDFIQGRFDEFRTNGWVATPNPEVAADVIIEGPAKLIPPSDDVVEMQVCEIDPWIVVEPGGGPDGTEAIVDAELYTYRSIFFLRNVDGRWLVEGRNEIGSWTGLSACPDA